MAEALGIFRETGDTQLIAWTAGHLAHLLRCDGAYGRATALFEESLALFREIEAPAAIGWALAHLATLARLRGDPGRAAALFGEALALLGRWRSEFYLSQCLCWASILAVERGAHLPAVRLVGAAESLNKPRDYVGDPDEEADFRAGLAVARATLGEDAFQLAGAEGRALTLDQAVDYALTVLPTLAATAGQPVPPAGGLAPLTPRECEVARLVALGRSNRQIAGELGMAERTVETHVNHALHKLGLTSRAQVAAAITPQPPATCPD